VPAAILDVDGTLVDTNYHHAIAWYRAFRRHGVTPAIWRIHRHIGMGGDQLVDAVAGHGVERERGEEIRAAEAELYMELIDEVRPFDGARELIGELKRRGDPVVLASSAKQDEVDHYLDLLEARDLAHGWTTSADVEATKPEPDLVRAALDAAGTDDAVMVGDTTWDVEAAARAGLETLAVLTGGYSAGELRDAGAVAVFDSVFELRSSLDGTPFA
jgi:HAD superfamily hydrolase (TIGR01549 family)